MVRPYSSVVRQSLHYLARPHSAIPRAPIASPAAWRGEELAARRGWRQRLTDIEIAELERAVESSADRPLAQLTREDFPLPRLRARVERWIAELREGCGVILVQGLPVAGWTRAQSERAFWGLGLHLGRPGAQNGAGDLLGHVRSEGKSYDDPSVRGYQTSAALAYHCDLADAVGLMCLQPAASGGRSRLVSSVRVYNELLAQRPDLAELLFEPMAFDTRGDAGVDFVRVIPCRYDAGHLRTLYHGDYLRSAEQHPGAPRLDARRRELLDVYDAIANAPGMALDFALEAGDAVLLSNHSVLHARTAYTEHEDPSRARELLRLWLSLGVEASAGGRVARVRELGRLAREVVQARLRGRA